MQVKARLLVLVEAERERLNNGGKATDTRPELMRAAQTHADDMAMKNSFDIDNPEGNVAVNTLLEESEIPGLCRREFRSPIFHARDGQSTRKALHGVSESIWENSPDHRSNLISRL